VTDLRLIKAGIDKRQIMDRIGAPHFSEGVFGVHEWNYLFNFYKHGSDEVTQCQYKILFDDHQLARSFYWKPESCADLVNPPHHEMKKYEPMAAQTFTLSTDALFEFNTSDAAHITPHGREDLAVLAQKITDAVDDIASVQVTGYTDRIGSDAYNDELSKRRADTVANELQQHGVPASKLTAEGRGKSDPVAECSEHKRAALIACLAPNRRVVVHVKDNHT
jgi:outer membrane protein OmpA-like peptidoglycan-associated protein